MASDHDQIRDLVERWHAATRAGDVDAVLALMTDDVRFLVPGRPPMDRAEFARLSTPPPGSPRPAMESQQTIEALEVSGDLACMQASLTVTVTTPGGTPVTRSGRTLTVFRKVGGRWLLARDANLLSITPS